MFTADQVWGLAVAADRINGGYFKEDVYVIENQCTKRVTQANKAMVKEWLRDGQFTEATQEDLDKGREVRHYFNGFLLKELSGKINDFERQALRLAQIDEFSGRNLFEFAVISCLPSVMVRDRARTDLSREIYDSEQLTGEVGDTIVGDITVVSNRYSKEYNRHKITARMGESFVDFWYKEAIEGELRIKGKIKQHRDNKTTALNYVKKA
jgi:hypothetical protein